MLNIAMTRRTRSWIGGTGGDETLRRPLSWTYYELGGKDWLRSFRRIIRGVETRNMCLNILRIQSVGNVKVKTGKQECPRGLSRVKSFGFSEVFKILMTGTYHERMSGTLHPMPPFIQGEFDGQQLTIPDIINPFLLG